MYYDKTTAAKSIGCFHTDYSIFLYGKLNESSDCFGPFNIIFGNAHHIIHINLFGIFSVTLSCPDDIFLADQVGPLCKCNFDFL